MKQSETVDKILPALAKVQEQMVVAKFDSKNEHFRNKYAGYGSIRELVGPPLKEAGVLLLQPVSMRRPSYKAGEETLLGDLAVVVETWLIHAASGQYLMEELAMPVPQVTPHAVGSARTYAMRYALAAMLAIATGDDDDGNAASGVTSNQQAKAPAKKASPKEEAPKEPPPRASEKQISKIAELAGTLGYSTTQIDGAVKKYALSCKEGGRTLDSCGPKTAEKIITLMQAKADEAAKAPAEDVSPEPPADSPERGRAIQKVKDLIAQYELKADMVNSVMESACGTTDSSTLDAKALMKLHAAIEKTYGQSPEDVPADLGGDV